MAQNIGGNVGFGSVVSSLFGGDAGKRPGAAHARMPRGGRLGELYWPVLVPAVLLLAYGLVVVWSASLTNADASLPRQALGAALGVVFAGFVWRYDYRNLQNMSTALLIADVVLMLLPRVPGLGYEGGLGMTGWVQLGPLRFQPSEVGKLVTIFLMASLCAQYNGRVKELREYVKLCGALLVPFLAILAQPDLGTGLILLVSGAAIIICSGPKASWVLVTLALFVAGCALIIVMSLNLNFPLKTYQVNRLLVFVNPEGDTSDTGYNLQQAKIAVGSGGLLGKGIGGATQSVGGFLPESHTDFVFALMAEEFGFVGSVALLALYSWMFASTIMLALRVEAPFSKLVLVGVVAMWAYQLLQNVGMCIGIMPITGIPLPFVSYGASSMVIQVTSVGIVQSVWLHRPKSA